MGFSSFHVAAPRNGTDYQHLSDAQTLSLFKKRIKMRSVAYRAQVPPGATTSNAALSGTNCFLCRNKCQPTR